MKWFALFAICLAGCGYVGAIPLNRPPRALVPKPPESVEVFGASRPERAFVDVAYLEADNAPNVVDRLRAAAGKMGCDAIIFNGRELKGTFAANCIVYR